MNASGLLNFRHCCALRLKGKSLHDSLHLFVLAGRHPVYLVGSLS